MTTGYPGKQSEEEVRNEHAPEQQKLPERNNHPRQILITNKFEALRHAETEGNTEHERKDTAPPPFVAGITHVQRLTASTEQVVNRLNYTLKIMNDTIKIITNKLEYHKTIREKKLNSTHTNLGNNVRTEW
jgi:hypothetical protein